MLETFKSAGNKVTALVAKFTSGERKISCFLRFLSISIPARIPVRRWCAPYSLLVAITALFLVINSPAWAGDLPDTPPDGWWWYYGQTPEQVGSLLKANNARLLSIQVEQTSPLLFTVAMVQNTGAYAKAWWWYYGQTESDIANHAKELNARIVNLDAYELDEKTYFAAIFISNTGDDARSWWWYFGQTPAQIGTLLLQHNARLIDFRQYSANGAMQYAAVMVENTGADATAWWWFYNISASQVSSELQKNGAYLVSLQVADTNAPTFNVIINKLPTPGGKGWWWYYGENALELTSLYTQNAAWLRDVKTYQINGERVFTALMLNTNPLDEWYTYRHDVLRTGAQPYASALSDPAKVATLSVNSIRWTFEAAVPGVDNSFKAGPIVANDTVFIGNENGYFYALDAATGKPKWQYPKAGEAALRGGDSDWAHGIESSAAYWNRPPNGAVIFAAQDPSLGPFCPHGDPNCSRKGSFGSARLFALDAKNGTEIWKSDPVAEINDDTKVPPVSGTELRETIRHSPPLVFDNKVYVGVQSFETPIQIGRVKAFDLASGHLIPTFQFQAVGTPASPPGSVQGGAVWNGPATDGTSLYFTTGNTNIGNPEPKPDYGDSMIRVDKDTGKISWHYQPLPYNLDGDTDWAAGATVMNTSCGELIASEQKDAWSYAIQATGPSCPLSGHSWQFPPTTSGCPFTGSDKHTSDGTTQPGAAWNDVFIIAAGGWSLVQDGMSGVQGRLHALNPCATTKNDRVRWIEDVPDANGYVTTPVVTGGIIFVGTNKGYLVALGDPTVVPPKGWRCSNTNPLYDNPSDCKAHGFVLVPIPTVLASVHIDDGDLTALRNEPAQARGRIFVGTSKGHVYMLEP